MEVSKKSWVFLVLSGVATGASWLCYYKALQMGKCAGQEEGEERLSQLYLKLVEEKRTHDLERVMRDKDFRDILYKRYGL